MPTIVTTTSTRAAKADLIINQGSTLEHVVSVQNSNGTAFDLTGYTVALKARPTVESSTVLIDLSTANGKIVVSGLAGQITLNMTNAETSALTWRTGYYDMEITNSGGKVTRLISGIVTVFPEVTR